MRPLSVTRLVRFRRRSGLTSNNNSSQDSATVKAWTPMRHGMRRTRSVGIPSWWAPELSALEQQPKRQPLQQRPRRSAGNARASAGGRGETRWCIRDQPGRLLPGWDAPLGGMRDTGQRRARAARLAASRRCIGGGLPVPCRKPLGALPLVRGTERPMVAAPARGRQLAAAKAPDGGGPAIAEALLGWCRSLGEEARGRSPLIQPSIP